MQGDVFEKVVRRLCLSSSLLGLAAGACHSGVVIILEARACCLSLSDVVRVGLIQMSAHFLDDGVGCEENSKVPRYPAFIR